MTDILTPLLAKSQGEGRVLSVRKRDGRVVPFDIVKIADAAAKAFTATGETDASAGQNVAAIVLSRLSGSVVDIEKIQDAVEETLMHMGYLKTARAYILYRASRAEARQIRVETEKSLRLIEDYLHISDWRVNENSNMSYSLQGLNAHLSSALTAGYWLSRIYPVPIASAHSEGLLHIHDAGSLSSYCVGWDLGELLSCGFGGVTGKVASSPARHFRTALGQIVNFFFTLQGEAAGAQALSNFDTLLAPFVRVDSLDYKSVYQCLQEFVFNLNVPTRTGFQTPFTNITMDLVPPSYLVQQAAVVGGELLDFTYGDCRAEMGLINKAFTAVMNQGDALGRPFTFPIPTYNLTRDFPWDDPGLCGLWEMTNAYGTPYFSNFIHSDMNPEDARSMCCRLRLDNREIRERETRHARGGLFSANPLTGSIGVVTLNLPRMAYLAKDEADFLERITHSIDLAAESLEIKRKTVEQYTEDGLYPYTRRYLEGVKNRTGAYWSNHFSTIGLLGMNEAYLNRGGTDYFTDHGREFAARILDHIRSRIELLREKTGHLYNLEASPAEGASYRLALLDRKSFPDIRTSGTEQIPYYTNSVHPGVSSAPTPFALLDHQDELQARFTGGTVVHVFTGEKASDPQAVKNLVRTIAQNYRLPYFSITPTYSICPSHGYLKGRHDRCPDCGAACEVYSRVVGYYRPVSNWNQGKQQEFTERAVFPAADRLVLSMREA